MSGSTTVVDGAALPWVNGAEVFETMEPAFRDHIGASREAALELLSRYHARSLWLDGASSRRIDHVRADPGYVDLSEAFHDSVEECYVLDGRVRLSAEGDLERGDYFWRPPGWVHSAASEGGFAAILMMEGTDPGEASERVTRVVRPDEDAGSQALSDGERAIGPRGYVRRAETRFMPWRPHDDTVAALGGTGLRAKVLSSNAVTGACSLLVGAPAGWTAAPAVTDRERFVVNTTGPLLVDGHLLVETGLVHVPAGASVPELGAPEGAELLVKVGGPR
ncbi:cupin domain-containing protein [Nocardioides pantholopis]|uniref:cupin domain-containing protein n=1 Tax=Nocardioides pantholopis TaxID=2483798 RepID=UPI0013E3879E|nr:hypothetical protein [Nocardioides pantholopis]